MLPARKALVRFPLVGVVLALLVASGPVRAAVVTRGPYLQRGTPTSAVVRWRTDVSTDSRVSYGPSPAALTSHADDPLPTTEHIIVLSGLAPSTTYFYSVGTAAAALAGGAGTSFVTPPLVGSRPPTRIWVVGDSGTGGAGPAAVRDAYKAFTGARRTDLWLMLGDNAYYSGTQGEYQSNLFDIYPEMLRTTFLWPALGNHDGQTANSATQTGGYYDIFTLPKYGEAGGVASNTAAYFSFDHANIHFICLDSYGTSRGPGSPMLAWLTQDLAATRQDWIIAFWHHPPYSKGSHDSDTEIELAEMRQNVLPILEGGGVDLVLCGHSHNYERSILLDGHYGVSTTLTAAMKRDSGDGRESGTGAYRKVPLLPTHHHGTVYVVAGTSAWLGGGALNHPVMTFSESALGSLVLDVDGSRLDARFLRETGAIDDSFTILKGSSKALQFYPVTPCRVVDTRFANAPALAAASTRLFPVTNRCGVPPTARAVAGNFTSVTASGPGSLTAYAADQNLPSTSNVSFRAGATRASNGLVYLGAAGDIAVRCGMAAGSTHFILDVSGYLQ